MSDLKILTAQERTCLGKGPNRRLRQKELTPGVFYSPKGENISVQIPTPALTKIFHEVGRTTVFTLEITSEKNKKTAYPVLIWQTQQHPVKNKFIHIDFYGVDLDTPIKVTVPLDFTGIAKGTKVGGKVETYHEQVILVAKPLEMPSKVSIDISSLDIGDNIHIADLTLPKGVQAVYETNYTIVSVLLSNKNASTEAEAETEQKQTNT